ncbi:hypothetical protein BGX33_012000 [Mortierella sp. NVP41]|nr:hypothetical protein BGX33_012000 [Mortierella sp. NVP41]
MLSRPLAVTTAPMPSTASTGGMDWDNFLASSDSTIQEDTPYKPPSMASFGFSALSNPEPVSATRQDHLPQQLQQLSQQQHQQRHQFPEGPQSAFQAHLSQPMNLTPANHAAFLEYLKSTAHPTTTTTTTTQSSAPSSTTTATPISLASATRPPPQFQYQPSPHQHTSNYYPASTARPLFSNDIQHQQHLDGSDVLAFLDSTSYSEFVDEVEAAGIEKHQQERREFVYSDEAGLGPAGGRHTRSIFSTLQLIQHLPSERQDIVQYLLQQGTYAEDVWSRPFGHDGQREEAASMAATQAEQDLFLQQQYQRKQQQQGDGDSEEGTDDATTEEMERVMKQIVENATEEVKTGQTDGRALNRLLMVRSHITMGTKL